MAVITVISLAAGCATGAAPAAPESAHGAGKGKNALASPTPAASPSATAAPVAASPSPIASPAPAPTASPVASASGGLLPASGAWWGAWVQPVGTQTDGQAVSQFETAIGRRLDVVHEYHAFDDAWPTATETTWASGGRILFANISPRESFGAVLTWSEIAGGADDSTLVSLAARLKSFGYRLFVSFDEEPEDRIHSDPTDYTAASFVAAWRHVHDLFAAAGVTNVVWVWNVSGWVCGGSCNEALYLQLWPGSAYVDWVAYDPYNWFDCPTNTSGWKSFDQVAAPFYDWSGQQTVNGMAAKPLMLAEWGSVENLSGATPTKGQWFVDAVNDLPARPKIKALVYFDQYDTTLGCDWLVTTSTASLQGYSTAGGLVP